MIIVMPSPEEEVILPVEEPSPESSGLESADRLAILPPAQREAVLDARTLSLQLELASPRYQQMNRVRRWLATRTLRRALSQDIPRARYLIDQSSESSIQAAVLGETKTKRSRGSERAAMLAAARQSIKETTEPLQPESSSAEAGSE